ncbi:MAG TPA: ElyC/SanA/YdcF family protein [Syntrophales bacterium]
MSSKKKILTYFLVLFLAILFVALYYGPRYLTYADKPLKSDAVVLFLGPDNKARQEDANRLMSEGYARYLFIPAYGRITEAASLSSPAGTKKANPKLIISGLKPRPYFENTHVEVLEARRMMEQYGLKSAIFVSSPEHMRRIKIIAEKIFHEEAVQIVFVPIRVEPAHQDLTLADYRRMGKEYVKIIWFLMYSLFRST